MSRRFQKILFIAVGVAVGVLFARFTTGDYLHGMIVLKENAKLKPLFMGKTPGKKTLALSIRNEQGSPDITITVKGGEVKSFYPPPVVLPFHKWIAVQGGAFRGLRHGMRLPLYVTLDCAEHDYELVFARASDGKVINTVPILTGENHGTHH
jgi:hypothetical protein